MNRFYRFFAVAVVGTTVIGGATVFQMQRTKKKKDAVIKKAAAEREARCKPVLSKLTALWVQHRPRTADAFMAGMNVAHCYQKIYFPALCSLHQKCIAACGHERCLAVGEAVGDSLGDYFNGRGKSVCKDFPPSHLSTDETLRRYCAQMIGVRVR